MPFFSCLYLLQLLSKCNGLLLVCGLISILFLLPQDVRGEPVPLQLERARSLATTNPHEGLDLAQKVAAEAEQNGDISNERQARGLMVDILRSFGNDAKEIALYREQLSRLDVLVSFEEEPARFKSRTLLSIFRAELALYLAENVEAVKLAREAVSQSENVEGSDIDRVAKVALGIALTRGILLGFLDEVKIYQQAYGGIDPRAFDEPFALLTQGFDGTSLDGYPFLINNGKQNLAFIYSQRREYEKALALYREIEPSVTAPPFVRAQHLINVANAEILRGRQPEAENHLDAVWDLLHSERGEPNEKGRANALLGSMDSFFAVGQNERAVQAFSESVETFRNDADGQRELLASINRYIIPSIEGRDESSIGAQILEKTLSVPGIGDKPSIALPLLAKLGRFYTRLWDFQKFGQVTAKAKALHAKAPDWKAVQELLIQEATIRRYLDPAGAVQAYGSAILAAGMASDGRIDYEMRFSGFRHAILLALEIGRYQDALDIALVQLTFLKTIRKDDPFEAIMEFLVETSRAMTKLGRFDLADDALSLAIGILPKVRADWDQRIQLAASEFYSLIGDTEQSLNHLNRVNKFSMAEHIAQSAPVLLRQRAEVVKQLGNYLAAEESLQTCILLATSRVIRQPDVEMECRWDLSQLLWEDLFEFEKSYEEYLKALKLSVAKIDYFAMAEMSNIFVSRGLLYNNAEPNQAIERSRETIKALQYLPATVRVDTYRAVSHLNVLFAQKKMGDHKIAWDLFDESLRAVMTEPYISVTEYKYLMLMGRLLKKMGENERALSVFNEVVKRIEYVRNVLTDPRLQMRLGSEVNYLYDEIVEIYLDQKSREGMGKALQTAEANRARSIQRFEEIGQSISSTDGSQGTVRDQARAKLDTVRKRNGYALTIEEFEAARDLFNLMFDPGKLSIGVRGPNEKPPVMPQTRSMPTLNLDNLQAKLSSNAAVIMYHLTGGLAGAWVITIDGLKWIELGNPDTVKAGILHYRTELLSSESGADQRLDQAARKAFNLLLAPLTTAIEGKSQLIIIPDASAFLIPFEALVMSSGADAGKFVIEKYSVTYHVSLGGLIRNGEPSRHDAEKVRTVLLVGNPTFPPSASSADSQERAELAPLAGAQREIERIREVVGSTNLSVYMGDDARKDRFQERLRQTTIAHFATHGVLNERYPWASYLALAGENGHLQLAELPRTPIVADLVVLSACETGRGRILAGEGVWGFQSQFLGAGAKNVVGTLWRVEDESTAEFMEEFYREMGPGLSGYANALRASKLKLIHSGKWHHPYYWAPFILYGEAPRS